MDGTTFLGVILIGGYILWFLLKSWEEGGKKNEDENKERNSKNGRIREKKKKVKMKRSIRIVVSDLFWDTLLPIITGICAITVFIYCAIFIYPYYQ